MGLDSGPVHLEKRSLKDLQIGRMGRGNERETTGMPGAGLGRLHGGGIWGKS